MRPILIFLSGCLLWANPVFSAVLTVDTTADDAAAHDTNPGDGQCSDSLGRCPLRAALEEANAAAALDTILFADSLANGTISIHPSEGPLPIIVNRVFILGESIDGYNMSATLLRDAPPMITLDGSQLTSGSSNGLSFSTAGASQSSVSAISIVGFPGHGIQMSFGADQIDVGRCFIGLQPDGASAGNAKHGIYAAATGGHNIGKARNGANTGFNGLGNVLSGNGQSGVRLETSDDNNVRGNLIGLSFTGTGDRGNGQYGISVSGNNNQIGDFLGDQRAGNFIAGNDLGGVYVSGNINRLVANTLGIGETGGFIASELDGIAVVGTHNTIGTEFHGGNRIVEHAGSAIHLGIAGGADANVNSVVNNQIGSPGTLFPLTYSANGQGITIAHGDRNIIRDNVVINSIGNAALGLRGEGIDVDGDLNLIHSNRVGFAPVVGGAVAEPNQSSGIIVTGNENSIGRPGFPNQVGGNQGRGIVAAGDENVIEGNFIGVTDSYQLIGNGHNGVHLQNGSGNVATMNVIGDNGDDGIGLSAASNAVISANWIGVSPALGNIGNHFDGIRVLGVQDSEVSLNRIAFNGRNAVAIGRDSSLGIAVFENSMYSNGALGIDLDQDGFTPNDPGDADEGPNRLQNFPVITSAELDTSVTPAMLLVGYTVDSTVHAAFYWSDRDETPQGRFFLGHAIHVGDPNDERTALLEFPSGAAGGWLTSVATTLKGGVAGVVLEHSSEFSPAFPFGDPSNPLFSDGFE